MYERNAIVLERYFEKIFGFKEKDNLEQNYKNYRDLIEKYEKYTIATNAENVAAEEFDQVSNELKKAQKSQEKLYNKGAKFEYSRYVIFNNIKETPDNIEKCLKQVQDDVDKNNEELKELGQRFVQLVVDYNAKKQYLEKCQEENSNAKNDFEIALAKTQECYKNILEEYIDVSKEFIASDNRDLKKDLNNTFIENGKNEKNPFDQDVIINTINISVLLYKIELEIYLTGHDRTAKLLNEIEADSVKMDKHKKYYNDSKVKLDFISAEKEYLTQFLDNERIAAIYDKKVHRKLMLEACKALNSDLEQINKLYDIILKEIAGRSTKKIYKENYNKEYLIDMERLAANPELDTNRMRTNAVALMNLNYWRIEGIRRIYDVFDKDITEIFGKDLSEYSPIKEEPVIDNAEDAIDFTGVPIISENIFMKEIADKDEDVKSAVELEEKNSEKIKKKKSKYGILKSSKQALANAIYLSLQIHEFGNKEFSMSSIGKKVINKNDNNDVQAETENTNYDKMLYSDLDAKIESLDWFDDEETSDNSVSKNINVAKGLNDSFDDIKKSEMNNFYNIKFNNVEDNDEHDLDNEYEYIAGNEEESILDLYFNKENTDSNKALKEENTILKNDTTNLSKSGSFLKRIIRVNSKKKREV